MVAQHVAACWQSDARTRVAIIGMDPHTLPPHYLFLVYIGIRFHREKNKFIWPTLPYPASATYTMRTQEHYSVGRFPSYPRLGACQASAAIAPVPPAAIRVSEPPPAARLPRGAPAGSQPRRSSAPECARTRRLRAGTSTSSELSPLLDSSP